MNDELINQANKYLESEDWPNSAKIFIRILCSALKEEESKLDSARRAINNLEYPGDPGNY